MDKTSFTPEESLLLISKTIEETKERFKENGHILIVWGCLIFIVVSSQYVLSLVGLYKKFDIAWTNILYSIGVIYTLIYTRREVKKNMPLTVLGITVGTMGWVVGLNFFILAVFFGNQLGNALAPIFLILFAFFLIMIGVLIKFKPIAIGGFILNLIGFATFLVHPNYYGLSLMLGAVVGFIIPGILLNITRRKDNV
ncbi:MAG: hypothetical protein PF436_07105 [Prolixibacteraceae bacterium]|jgi:hypothetical protein|nr:hypothetical protein [Prolixibacteraceae bacterium]